jgi:hypothetical protein
MVFDQIVDVAAALRKLSVNAIRARSEPDIAQT